MTDQMTQTGEHDLLDLDRAHPRVRVVGGGEVAAALGQLARVLRWDCTIVERSGEQDDLAFTDAMIVLSHDLEIAGAALTCGLNAHLDYVGGMGSRTTQRRRREWLMAHRVNPDLIDQIHGPAGLDIGADGPAEIALSIMAEINATRTGSSGGSISARRGSSDRVDQTAGGPTDCPGG